MHVPSLLDVDTGQVVSADSFVSIIRMLNSLKRHPRTLNNATVS